MTADEVAKLNGWHKVGNSEVKVEIPITDDEKLELGKASAESIGRIQQLENELADIKSDFKGKIEAHDIIVRSAAQILRDGKKSIYKVLPYYLNRERTKRLWLDLDTGEIVQEDDAQKDDLQMRID